MASTVEDLNFVLNFVFFVRFSLMLRPNKGHTVVISANRGIMSSRPTQILFSFLLFLFSVVLRLM